jgi:methylmalonyl-CoA mutase
VLHAPNDLRASRDLSGGVLEGPGASVALLRTVCSCSVGQITLALYEAGGQYRRSMVGCAAEQNGGMVILGAR